MSGLINKAKEALSSDKKDNAATHDPHSTSAGAHGTGTHGVGTGTTGAGYGSTHSGPTGAGYGSSTTAGPHDSNLANKVDPRVDSDRDGRGPTHGAGTTGAGYGSTHTGTTGAGGYGSSATTAPHGSNIANKVDPRVDSTHGAGTTGAGYGSTHSGTTGAGYGSTTTGTTGAGYGASGLGDPHSTNAGPHGSNVANQADPRIDSDMDGGHRAGFGTSGAGHTGAGYAGTNRDVPTGAGYGSATTDSTGAAHAHDAASGLPGSGNASNTAGPHNSNLLNKLDPRVDSNLDGSKTMGGNATHQ